MPNLCFAPIEKLVSSSSGVVFSVNVSCDALKSDLLVANFYDWDGVHSVQSTRNAPPAPILYKSS